MSYCCYYYDNREGSGNKRRMTSTLGAVRNSDLTAVLHHRDETGDFKLFCCFFIFVLEKLKAKSYLAKSLFKTQNYSPKGSMRQSSEGTNAFLSSVSWRKVTVRSSSAVNKRMRVLYLGFGHAVEMHVPPVGHVRQQVAVVDGVAVQMHALGLDQQDYIWRGGSDVSEEVNRLSR